MLVLGPHGKNMEYSRDKSNLGNPKVDRGCHSLIQPHFSRLHGNYTWTLKCNILHWGSTVLGVLTLCDPTAGWLSHLALAISHTCLLLISLLWHRQAIFESKGPKLSSSSAEYMHTYIDCYRNSARAQGSQNCREFKDR